MPLLHRHSPSPSFQSTKSLLSSLMGSGPDPSNMESGNTGYHCFSQLKLALGFGARATLLFLSTPVTTALRRLRATPTAPRRPTALDGQRHPALEAELVCAGGCKPGARCEGMLTGARGETESMATPRTSNEECKNPMLDCFPLVLWLMDFDNCNSKWIQIVCWYRNPRLFLWCKKTSNIHAIWNLIELEYNQHEESSKIGQFLMIPRHVKGQILGLEDRQKPKRCAFSPNPTWSSTPHARYHVKRIYGKKMVKQGNWDKTGWRSGGRLLCFCSML